METININTGMNLHVIQSTKFKTATICVLLRRPLERSEATYNALLPNVLRRGCSKYDTIAKINRQMEDMYGSSFDAGIVKKGEEQILQFFLEITNIKGENLVPKGLEFLKEIILNPLTESEAFSADIVSSEIGNLKNIIEGRMNNKTEYAKLRCLEEMCPKEPFGIYADGYISDLSQIDNTKLYWHYKRILLDSPIEFVIIGNVNEKEIAFTIRELFNFERGNVIKMSRPLPGVAREEINTVKEPMEVAQGKICIGLRSGVEGNQEDFYKLMVLNEIFGGGPNSKLFTNVREKESLCYSINSFIYRFKGIMFIQCGADTKKLNMVLKMVEASLNEMKQGKFTKEEYTNAIRGLAKKYKAIQDSPANTLDFYLSQYMLDDGSDLFVFIKKFSQVKPEDIERVANKLKIDTVYTLEGVR